MMYLSAVGTLCTITGAIIYFIVRMSITTHGMAD